MSLTIHRGTVQFETDGDVLTLFAWPNQRDVETVEEAERKDAFAQLEALKALGIDAVEMANQASAEDLEKAEEPRQGRTGLIARAPRPLRRPRHLAARGRPTPDRQGDARSLRGHGPREPAGGSTITSARSGRPHSSQSLRGNSPAAHADDAAVRR